MLVVQNPQHVGAHTSELLQIQRRLRGRMTMQKSRIGLLAVVVAMLGSCLVRAAEHGPAFTDPEKAGVDYQLQGEYVGEVETDNGVQTFGAQVIALGSGTFEAVGYPGGLPGAGWQPKPEAERRVAEGRLVNGEVVFQVEQEATAKLREGVITIEHSGRTIGTLRKVNRQSPTLGCAARRRCHRAVRRRIRRVVRERAARRGPVPGRLGLLRRRRPLATTSCTSSSARPSCRTLAARGVATAASTCKAATNCRCSIPSAWKGKDNECGGIYSVAQPSVNMCFPPLVWQTYDIDFVAAQYDAEGKKQKNARVTIRHNGVVIHDNLELPHGTPGRLEEGPGPAPLFLQHHGNPVVFRNIWAVKR